VALNIGGIANVTVIPAGAQPRDVFAFDTGPGNMVMDALVENITNGRERYDEGARIASKGQVVHPLLEKMLSEAYLLRRPPKTTGREQFGRAYATKLLSWGRKHRARHEDLVRTATIFTALSIVDAFRRFILPRTKVREVIVAGGGTKNPLIMVQLEATLGVIAIVHSSELGVAERAKEAFAFAILAYEAFHGRANNLPSATGARHSAVMGKLVHGQPR